MKDLPLGSPLTGPAAEVAASSCLRRAAALRMLEDESFKMPVGSDGMPRWKSCTSSPCAKVPTLVRHLVTKAKKQ
jgi:hypothetical protein